MVARAFFVYFVATNGLLRVKTIVQADIMIDDHFKKLDYVNGQTLLFTAHHNVFSDAGRHTRVNNWVEIAGILL